MEAASTTSSAASSVDGRSSSVGGSDFLNRGMFSGQQESLLVGTGGVFSLGNGFGNDSGISGGVNSSSGTSFDLSDFPSLGGGVSNNNSASGLAAALREQQQILAHQQMQLQGGTGSGTKSGSNLYMLAMTGTNGNNFQMANEDFPALGGGRSQSSSSGVGNGSGLNVSSLLSNNAPLQTGSTLLENGLYGGNLESGIARLEGGAGLLSGAGLGGLSGLRNAGTSMPSAPMGATSAGAIGSSTTAGTASVGGGNALSGDYGLLGLLGVIRMTDADRNSLALGSDLQLLGLNLGSTEQIYGTFASPWSEGVATKEPHYQVSCRLRDTTRSWVLCLRDSSYIICLLCRGGFSFRCVITCSHRP
jgi:CCR4-NOT transcription complex subunit 2